MAPRRLRAPQQDGAVVAEPPLAEVGRLLTNNRQQLSQASGTILGRSWDHLRRQARQTALEAARDYLRRAGEPVPGYRDASLLMAGHQPDLFHAGVWLKNFALNGLARKHAATPINLIVDNDTAKTTALRIPSFGPGGDVRVVAAAFDHWAGAVPYEDREVQDETLFAHLPDRAAEAMRAWSFVPLLPDFWAEALRQVGRTRLLGERLVAARRAFERRWGCHNLELPVSLLCQTEAFAWFICHVLAELPRFHATYNASVLDYRRQYRIRSRHHPVPELAAEDGWLEVPLWAWRRERPHRRRLLARPTKRGIGLRIGEETGPTLPPISAENPEAAVAVWLDLERQGLKTRSRALTNTLYARLFLADLFIHGIGGGRYDELTDEIIRRFYGFEPPAYFVLSATLLLPLPTYPARPKECSRLSREIRDLHWNPQRHLPPTPTLPHEGGREIELSFPHEAGRETERSLPHEGGGRQNFPSPFVGEGAGGGAADPTAWKLAALKEAWIARQPADAAGRRERFQRLQELTHELRCYVADRERTLHEALVQCHRHLQANAILQDRDYAFCLHAEARLRKFCTQFL